MIELIPTVATSFVTAMAANSMNGAKGPAQALDDIMSLVGFEKLHFYAEKKRAKNEIYIKDYKEKIAQELVKIPEENIQEPPLSIVGPALEASKFYMEEEELRNMFAKLVSSSMDSAKNSSNHSSFVEIIKQMDFVDATILKYTFFKAPSKTLALANLSEQFDNGGTTSFSENIVDFSIEGTSTNKIASSIQNLNRLGLIAIDYMSNFTDESHYNYVEQSDSYKELFNQVDNDINRISVTQGIGKITPYGNDFCITCL